MSALLGGITSNHSGNFSLNCPHSDETKDKLKKHENVCKNHDYCYVEIPEEDNNFVEGLFQRQALRRSVKAH